MLILLLVYELMTLDLLPGKYSKNIRFDKLFVFKSLCYSACVQFLVLRPQLVVVEIYALSWSKSSTHSEGVLRWNFLTARFSFPVLVLMRPGWCMFEFHAGTSFLGTAALGPQLNLCSFGHPCLHFVSSCSTYFLRLRNQSCIEYLKCCYIMGVYINKMWSSGLFVLFLVCAA